MEGGGGDDGCHLDEFCQLKGVSKKLKKDDNLDLEEDVGPSHEEMDIEGKNPFQIQVILDVVFKMLSFEEMKKFRLVSSAWNQVGATKISKRHQKPIKFNRVEEFGQDDKLGALVQLQRRHNEIFPHDHHQLFSYFTFNIFSLMLRPNVDQFFDHFSPKFVELFGECDINGDKERVLKLCEFLIKISPTIQEIKFNFSDYSEDYSDIREENLVQELISKPFPNLRKISNNKNIWYNDLKDVSIYSLIGQNSPKLHHLKLRSFTSTLGSPGFMKEQFEQSGLVSKLRILDLFISGDDFDRNYDYVKIFAEFGQNEKLKLTKLQIDGLKCKQDDRFDEIFVPLIASQAETLKILEISTSPFLDLDFDFRRVPFPSLQNLSILQIDNLSTFKQYFEPINFDLQIPKLVEFKTNDIDTFLAQNLGRDGGSVKSVRIFKNPEDIKRFNSSQMIYPYKKYLDIVLVHQIFPNLEFLEVDIFNLKLLDPFWPQLKKVVIRCELKDLHYLRKEILQDAKSVELVVDCGSKLIDEDSYKEFFGGLINCDDEEYFEDWDHYSRNKYYKQFLDKISDEFTSLLSVSFTFIGHKISEDFKRDFRAILPHSNSVFICTPFKSTRLELFFSRFSTTYL